MSLDDAAGGRWFDDDDTGRVIGWFVHDGRIDGKERGGGSNGFRFFADAEVCLGHQLFGSLVQDVQQRGLIVGEVRIVFLKGTVDGAFVFACASQSDVDLVEFVVQTQCLDDVALCAGFFEHATNGLSRAIHACEHF